MLGDSLAANSQAIPRQNYDIFRNARRSAALDD
jgi:hypothetical protein